MKRKPPPPKKNSNSKAPPPKGKAAAAGKKPAFGKKPKPKIPSLGSGMMGLGGTGAQGMMP